MRKFFSVILACLLIAALGCAATAVERTAEMKKMSVFISNFTEAGFFNFDLENGDNATDELNEYEEPITHLGNPANITELVRFGIIHNLINNYKSRIKKCKDPNCEAGGLTIDKKFVFESVKKYLGLDISRKDLSVIAEDPSAVFSYDGKLFHFDADSFKEPGNDKVYYADVQGVTRRGKNLLLAGDIYNSKQITDRPGMFAATVRPVNDTWVIIDMTTDWVTNAGRD